VNLDYFHKEVSRVNRILNSSSNLLLFFVNDIIDFSRIRSSKFKRTVSRFQVGKAIHEIKEIVQSQADSQETKIEVELHHDFSYFGGQITTDRQRLQQVLLNLLSNAIKFTRKGVVTVKIMPSQDPVSKKWRLVVHVRDSGAGMTQEEQSKLFKLFGVMQNTSV